MASNSLLGIIFEKIKYKKNYLLLSKNIKFIITNNNKFYLFNLLNNSIKNGYIMLTHLLLPKDNNHIINIALIYASQHGKVDIVNLLLSLGADIQFNNCKCLFMACDNVHIEIVNILLLNGNIPYGSYRLLLEYNCINRNLKIARLLLSYRTVLPDDIAFAFWTASRRGYLDIISLLLSHFTDLDPRLKNEALIEASIYGHIELVYLLLLHGANASYRRNEALIKASEKGHLEIVDALISHGARW